MSVFVNNSNFMNNPVFMGGSFLFIQGDGKRYRYIKLSEVVDKTIGDIVDLTLGDLIREEIIMKGSDK